MIQWEQQGFGDQELLAGAAIPYPFFSANRGIGPCLAEAVYIGILKNTNFLMMRATYCCAWVAVSFPPFNNDMISYHYVTLYL